MQYLRLFAVSNLLLFAVLECFKEAPNVKSHPFNEQQFSEFLPTKARGKREKLNHELYDNA